MVLRYAFLAPSNTEPLDARGIAASNFIQTFYPTMKTLNIKPFQGLSIRRGSGWAKKTTIRPKDLNLKIKSQQTDKKQYYYNIIIAATPLASRDYKGQRGAILKPSQDLNLKNSL